jgi:integrase
LAQWDNLGKRRNKEQERKKTEKWKESLDTHRPSHGRSYAAEMDFIFAGAAKSSRPTNGRYVVPREIHKPTTGALLIASLRGSGGRCLRSPTLRGQARLGLTVDHFQRREDHWAIVDLIGKAGHVRTIPVPSWVKRTVDDWLAGSNVVQGRLFRCVCKRGTTWGTEMTDKVVRLVVKQYAAKVGITKLAPHDLRRSRARLCHSAGGEMEQIQFLLGHVSVQTT